MAKKSSFFQRLTGSVSADEFEEFDEEVTLKTAETSQGASGLGESWDEEETAEGQLTVDVFQTPDEIVIRSIVAGVRPDDLDVAISRDMVTIRGTREENKEVSDEGYFHKELFWGTFSRTILLPAEIEVEGAQATEKYGILTLRLPKIDKNKQTKVKVRSS